MFKGIRAVGANFVDDIKKVCFLSLCILQAVLIVFYGYSIYANIDQVVFLISYSILCLLSIVYFIIFLIKHNNKKVKDKGIKRFKKHFAYVLNLIMIIFKIVEMFHYGIDDFSKVLLIVSGLILFIQIILEAITLFIERYIKDLNIAIDHDLGYLRHITKKSTILKLIDAPLEKLALLKEGKEKEKTDEEIRIDKHIERFEERQIELSIAKAEKKEEERKEEEKRIKNEIEEIKQHLKMLFDWRKKS